jgi:drug/metabolite transporter (DMT)-like permease
MRDKSASGIPIAGMLALVGLCFLWGANVVAIKISIAGVPPLFTAALRSGVAAILLVLYCRMRGYAVFIPKKELRHALIIGVLFAFDFLFLYWGNQFTHASRAVIFLYTQPFWTALGAHFILKGDRLNLSKCLALVLAFAGLIPVYLSRPPALSPLHWIGDFMLIGAAIFWAATTLYVKKMAGKMAINHYQSLFAQLFFSIPLLSLASLLFEHGRPVIITAPVMLSLLFQCIIVAFFSYMVWFWMIHRYAVSTLAIYTFLAPIFGVILSGIFLGETIPAMLWIGLVLVAGGIYLVNKNGRAPAESDESVTTDT